MGWSVQPPLVTSMGSDQMLYSLISLSREECLTCAAIVFFFLLFFDGYRRGGNSTHSYNHLTLVAVLVGPLALMTCGLLVLLPSLTRCQSVPTSGRKTNEALWVLGVYVYWDCDLMKWSVKRKQNGVGELHSMDTCIWVALLARLAVVPLPKAITRESKRH